MSNALKVMTVVGTRPEIIRLSAVIERLDLTVKHVLVHTGQNYEYALNDVFFRELAVRRPDHCLAVDTSTVARAYGNVMIESERVMVEERPDAVLVLGDTNSSIAAVIAKRRNIPVYHMEAGNRSYDENVPEETNRRIVDHVADFNLVYTERARQHLVSEGLPHRRTYLTGSPLREVFERYRGDIADSDALSDVGVKEKEFFLVSVHREENVDSPVRLRQIVACLQRLANTYGRPVVVSTHPRTRRRLEALGEGQVDERVLFLEPFGYLSYNRLQQGAACVVSDSGSVSEEAAILGFPAITIRDSMERPEALDSGSVILTGLNPDRVIDGVEFQMRRWSEGRRPSVPVEYEIADTSERVVGLILGTAGLSNAWSGVRTGEGSV